MVLHVDAGKRSHGLPSASASLSPGAGEPLAVTLIGASKADLALLASALHTLPALRIGPRQAITQLSDTAPQLLTPLALLDVGQLPTPALLSILNDAEILRRPQPCVLALVDPTDQLSQRLLRAAPLMVAAVAPRGINPTLLAAALRFMAAPLVIGWSQLWFGGLAQPPAPLLARGHADLQLLQLLLHSTKLSEAATSLGYTRRGVQAQVAGLCNRVGVRRVAGRLSTARLAGQILDALR